MPQDEDIVSAETRRHAEAIQKLRDVQIEAVVDPLTGVFRREIGESYLEHQLSDGKSPTLVLLRVVALNKDSYDLILGRVGEMLLEFRGTFEVVCRWDNDNFALMSAQAISDEMIASLRSRLAQIGGNDGYTTAAGFFSTFVGKARMHPGDSIASVFARLDTDSENKGSVFQRTLENVGD